MKLSELFGVLSPYLAGRAAHADTAAALYGEATGIDAQRLAIYGRQGRQIRQRCIGTIFALCREEVAARLGEEGWHALVDAYFDAWPCRSFALPQNGAHLPEHLRGRADLSPWLAELAALEWRIWEVERAPDDPADEATGGPLRLRSTARIDAWRHDLLGWIGEAGSARARSGPALRPSLVITWRDSDLSVRHADVGRLDAFIARELGAGRLPAQEGAAALGATEEDVAATLADLREIGVVLGAPSAGERRAERP